MAKTHSKKAEGSTRKPRLKKKVSTEDNPQGRSFKDIKKMFEAMGTAQDKESREREPEPRPEERKLKRS